MADRAGRDRPNGATVGAILAGLAPLLYPLFHRGTLIDPIPAALTWAAALIAGALGLAATIAAYRSSSGTRRSRRTWVTLAALPIIATLLGTSYARFAAEAVAFAGVDPVRTEIDAPIESLNRGKARIWEPNFAAFVRPDPGARKLWVRVTREVYEQLTLSARKGCIRIHLETGRSGVRRTRLPNAFDPPVGLDRWRPCATTDRFTPLPR